MGGGGGALVRARDCSALGGHCAFSFLEYKDLGGGAEAIRHSAVSKSMSSVRSERWTRGVLCIVLGR